MYLTHSERTRNRMAAGIVLAGAIGIGAGMAGPLPESVSSPLYELVLVDAAGESFVVDYGLTLADCVARKPDFPGFAMSCERAGSR